MLRGLLPRLRALPGNVRGALWILLAGGIFSAMDATIKLVGQGIEPGGGLHAFQIGLFRSLLGAMFAMPFLMRRGVGAFATTRLGGHSLRGLIGYCAMALGFYALTHLPLADAVAISFTRTLFTVILAVLFLGEVVRWRRWTATAVGFGGILVMVRPGAIELNEATVAAIFSACFVAGASVLMKKLAETERPESIIFYSGMMTALFALVPAILVWRHPTALEWTLLISIGMVGSIGQYCVIRALRIAEATALDPFDYSRLIYATAFGIVLFGQWPDLWTLIGAAIIVASTSYIAHREATLRRRPGRAD